MKQYRYLESEDIQALLTWHRWLDDHRGDRARLRRAESPEDILLTDAFFHFLKKMPETDRWRKNFLTSASVAGVLSQVKINTFQYKSDKDDSKKVPSFARQLATAAEGKSKAPMSELRFQQLQKSKTTDDFFRRILRAVQLLKGQANIVSLANDIIHWHLEFEHQVDRVPANRLAVRWATDYFTALPKN